MPAAENNLQLRAGKRPGDPGALLLLGLVKEKTGDYAKAAQLLDSQFELVAAQPDRTVALFHSLIETGQADKITKIVDVLKLHTNDQSWAGAVKPLYTTRYHGRRSGDCGSLVLFDSSEWLRSPRDRISVGEDFSTIAPKSPKPRNFCCN